MPEGSAVPHPAAGRTGGTAETLEVRAATAADHAAVRRLLADARLPLDGVPGDLTLLLVAERAPMGAGTAPTGDRAGDRAGTATDREIVGAIALEEHGGAALLRSAVVAKSCRGTGIGERLVARILEDAKARGNADVVLLTETAARWFPRFGFAPIPRERVPASLHASREFQGACPASAVAMHRAL